MGHGPHTALTALPLCPSCGKRSARLDFSALTSPAFLSVVFVMLFVDFFDTTGTLTAISEVAGKRKEDGSIDNIDKAVYADTSASVVGALAGTSNMTTYLESAAGIRAGGTHRPNGCCDCPLLRKLFIL